MSKREQELKTVERWIETANSNTLLGFNHRVLAIQKDKKVSIDQAKILAYRKMKRIGMI